VSDEIKQEIGKRLHQIRKDQRRNLVSVAFRAGCSPGELSQYENGLKLPGTARLLHLAAALNVSIAELVPVMKPLNPDEYQSNEIPAAETTSEVGVPPASA
jgi:transcriptional regulator with XRE-family HTH domain